MAARLWQGRPARTMAHMMRLSRVATLAVLVGPALGGAEEPAATLLEAPAPLAAALRSRFGNDFRVLRLSMRGDGAEVEVQDPAVPLHVDRYAFEDGALGKPEPVPVGRSQRALDARLFSFSEVDLSILLRLLPDARERAQTEGAEVAQVSIERSESHGDSPTWGRPLILVHVSGPRGGALVEYGLDGKKKRVHRW